MTGPMGRRVLKFDGAFGPEGCGSGSAAVFYAACGISPGGGDLRCAYFSADLNSSTHSGE